MVYTLYNKDLFRMIQHIKLCQIASATVETDNFQIDYHSI